MSLTVDLCAGFQRIGVATAYTFDAVIRNLAAGEWRLSAPLAGLEVASVEAIDSVIVSDDAGRVVFAGRISPAGGAEAGTTREVTPTGTLVRMVGIDIFGLLSQRIVYPNPAQPGPVWNQSHDERTGPGSTVAAEFIDVNAGTSALADRAIPNLTVVDPESGVTSTWSGRFQPLDEFVGRICREAGIVCHATMPTAGAFRFEFGSPADQSDRFLFTDQGDLEGVARLLTPAEGTFVVGAGQGQLTARTFAVADAGHSGVGRVEQVYENTNITSASALNIAAATQLELSGPQTSVDVQLSANATQRIRFLDDYRIGDWLGIEVAGLRYKSQVEAVRISIASDETSVAPVLGRASTNPLNNLIRDVAGLASRFDTQID